MYPETILPITAHIPHAGFTIPSAVTGQFLPGDDALWQEIITVTDWYTHELFRLPGIAACQTPISRLVVDLERYVDDELEPNAALGRGVVYSLDSQGADLRREISDRERDQLIDNYYRPHHLGLELALAQQLSRWGHCLLLDCHSFPDQPFGFENDKGNARPDICLGTSVNTPAWLLEHCTGLFQQCGYSVAVDFPYPGCLVPEAWLGDTRVPAIMVEVNRRLYLEGTAEETWRVGQLPEKLPRFESLRHHIWSVMLALTGMTTCRIG